MAAPTKVQFLDPSVSFPAINPSREMRILRLSSSTEHPINCVLRVEPVNEPEPYEALSYVWGNKEDLKVITVDDHAFRVTQNLYDALKSLIPQDGSTRDLWIDAICINQNTEPSGLAERGHQVRLMTRIYSSAANVVAYLGEPYPSLPEALEFLTVAAGGRQSEVDRLTQSVGYDIPQVGAALQSFFSCPWWNRVWTVQEAISASKLLYQLGRRSIDAKVVATALLSSTHLRRIRNPFPPGSLSRATEDPVALRPARLAEPSLITALETYRTRDSGDPRDKIYSLMGLSIESEGLIETDYEISAGQLFKNFTLACIHKHENLTILGHLYDPALRSQKDMPSFSVDWGYRPPRSNSLAVCLRTCLEAREFDACRGSKPFWEPEADNLVRSNGFIFDSIEATGPKGVFQPERPPGTRRDADLRALIDIMCMAMERGEEGGRGSKLHLVDVLYTLCAGFKNEEIVGPTRLASGDEDKLKAWWRIDFPASVGNPARGLGSLQRDVMLTAAERIFIFTNDGRMGLAPHWCEPGDAIAIMGGGKMPIVLRPAGEVTGRDGKTSAFEVIGEAYVLGVMDGEAFGITGRADSEFDDIYLL